MKIAYVRVSTEDQNTARQLEAIKNLDIERIFEEKVSGKDMNRPVLKEMLGFVREGDVVYIESISRLGRSLRDLLEIVDLLHTKKVGLVSLKENHIDTTTPSGMLIFSICSSLAEYERSLILLRQREGIEVAKREGKYKGRKKIEVDDKKFNDTYKRWKKSEITAVKAMQIMNLKKSTFYRRVAELENADRH